MHFRRFYGEGKSSQNLATAPAATPLSSSSSNGDGEEDEDDGFDDSESLLSSTVESETSSNDEDPEIAAMKIDYKRVFSRSWMYFLTGYVNYSTTLCIFPALTSLGKSKIDRRSEMLNETQKY